MIAAAATMVAAAGLGAMLKEAMLKEAMLKGAMLKVAMLKEVLDTCSLPSQARTRCSDLKLRLPPSATWWT